MHAITFTFILSGLFTATIAARAVTTTPPFEVTRAKIHQVQGCNTTFEFMVYDPDPLTNATAKCSYTWKTGSSAYPQAEYSPCSNSSFAWNMASYEDIYSFVLGIEHVFTDPAIGAYPYDEVTNFGKANVSTPDSLWCIADDEQTLCEQHVNVTVKAPIYATIAKRR
ncbi:hypothetical protein LTR36_003470 [Oleoguttula mirabilis]|uniref:AA1-like domain-containing protein n=1 Tax=Oleoguttula mirabilis TaxID=1507867 RepID=A0AAV9JJ50_9PEZI|nr:hypothetical protein LTR36_003470 [Oleoguttula mirabilis]